jgi:anti-sigma regulatory factor (Ser/Thr protein kinase)
MAALEALPRQRRHAADPAAGRPCATVRELREVRDRTGPRPMLPPPHPDIGLASGWPLLDFLELGALPGAVPCGRLHTRHILWEWRLTGLADSAELVVAELLTNAVAASWGDRVLPVRLWLLSDAARLLVLVWDTNPLPPLPGRTGEDAESGRGLMLVDAVSARWNWYPAPDAAGKAVWALCER